MMTNLNQQIKQGVELQLAGRFDDAACPDARDEADAVVDSSPDDGTKEA